MMTPASSSLGAAIVMLAADAYAAGDYTATLEGAVRSGVKCAELLLAEAI